MPNHKLDEFITRLEVLEKAIGVLQNDAKWLKWILMGAAGLGFIEKIFGWLVK